MYYYDVHVFFSRNKGYSFGLKSEKELTDDEVIELANKQNQFQEEGDGDYVDTVDEIDEAEYLDAYGE